MLVFKARQAGLYQHLSEKILSQVGRLRFACNRFLERGEFSLVFRNTLILAQQLHGNVAIQQVVVKDIAVSAHAAIATALVACFARSQGSDRLTRVGFSLTQPEKGPEEEKRGEYSCQVA